MSDGPWGDKSTGEGDSNEDETSAWDVAIAEQTWDLDTGAETTWDNDAEPVSDDAGYDYSEALTAIYRWGEELGVIIHREIAELFAERRVPGAPSPEAERAIQAVCGWTKEAWSGDPNEAPAHFACTFITAYLGEGSTAAATQEFRDHFDHATDFGVPPEWEGEHRLHRGSIGPVP